MLGRFDGDSLR